MQDALRLEPVQKGVDCDRPSPDEAAKCKIYAKKIDGHIGWLVEDANGTLLRRFLDTNGDNIVDQWSYFKDGIEVYRDIDADFNGKADQHRWFNTAGSRWGIDKHEDGTINFWKAISAEEVSAEVVAALAKRDTDRFLRLALTSDELKGLGLGETKQGQVKDKIDRLQEEFAKFSDIQKIVAPTTRWVQFSASQPGIVPAGTDGSTADLAVYENAVAVVETEGKHNQLQIGTLLRVGDAWRLIDVPRAMADGQGDAAGFFFRGPRQHVGPHLGQRPQRGPAEALERLGEPGPHGRDRHHGRAKSPLQRPAGRPGRADRRQRPLTGRKRDVDQADGRHDQRGRAAKLLARRREATGGPAGQDAQGRPCATWRRTSSSAPSRPISA